MVARGDGGECGDRTFFLVTPGLTRGPASSFFDLVWLA